MKCKDCGKGMADGVTLIRQNEKGVAPIWCCKECNKKSVDPLVQEIIDVLDPEVQK